MKKLCKWGVLIGLVLACLLCSACDGGGGDSDSVDLPFRDLTWAVGGAYPDAKDFIPSLPEGYSVRFAKDYDFSDVGSYRLELIVTDERGRETTHEVGFTLMLDTEAPKMEGVKDLQAYIGDGIAYRSGVTVTDNCHGKTTLEVDSSAVITDREGAYPVTYTATDAAGNRTTVTVTLYLYREKITLEMLYAQLDPLIAQYVPTAGSPKMQAQAVYQYVYFNVRYAGSSDKSEWIRAAYDGLRTGSGDCYTYFALSKAFFERLGIANMDSQRTQGLGPERHYWNFVNIGTESDPRWYHFDACPLQGVQHSGCLLTDAQVDAYTRIRTYENGVGNYFYAYDKSAFPASATDVITPTPSLEPYMEG